MSSTLVLMSTFVLCLQTLSCVTYPCPMSHTPIQCPLSHPTSLTPALCHLSLPSTTTPAIQPCPPITLSLPCVTVSLQALSPTAHITCPGPGPSVPPGRRISAPSLLPPGCVWTIPMAQHTAPRGFRHRCPAGSVAMATGVEKDNSHPELSADGCD